MVDPVGLSAGAIATLVATKAFEKTGENLSESTWNLVKKFLNSLKLQDPATAVAIEKVARQPELAKQQPDNFDLALLISKVEDAARDNLEVRQDIQAIADIINQPQSKLADQIGVLNQNVKNVDLRGSRFF
ncbi:hypothetical protein [Microcoleus sp. herbarium14]|uniref:hypothetical protein n=1 Tax=Microcoleus sp. herbarium14 TaxID=3055439 RepID=UPI002FD163E1